MTLTTASRTPAPTSTRWAAALATPVRRALRHPWVESIVRESAVEDALQVLHPLLSLSMVRVKVVKILDETHSTKTFVLQPNTLWQGGLAGQFVTVQLEINGRREERVYSLSSRPGARRIAITVKRQIGGLVSSHLHDTVRVGDVFTISQAMGEFVLPAVLAPKILLLSAGSGITPVMAMLRDLRARRYQGDIVFLHVCRNTDDLIFSSALRTMALESPELSLLLHQSDSAGRFTTLALQAAVPDLAERSTWLCGPSALMDMVHQYWRDAAIPQPLASERFVAFPILPTTSQGTPVAVQMVATGHQFVTEGNAPLLVQAERAGLTPKHGCRIGICRSCQCVKKTGTVENLTTGALSSAPNELIRLCISVARTDIALDL